MRIVARNPDDRAIAEAAEKANMLFDYFIVKYGSVKAAMEAIESEERKSNAVEHPAHYNQFPVECWDINEQLPGNLAAAFKHLWRCGLKGSAVEDLQKAEQYIEREIGRHNKIGQFMFSGTFPLGGKELYRVLDQFPAAIYGPMSCIIEAAFGPAKSYPTRPLRDAVRIIQEEIARLQAEGKASD